MKIGVLITLFVLVLVVGSCGRKSQPAIVGRWQYWGLQTQSGFLEASKMDSSQFGEMGKRLDELKRLVIEFKENGSGEASGYKASPFTWTRISDRAIRLEGEMHHGERRYSFRDDLLFINWAPKMREYVFKRMKQADKAFD